MTISQQLREQTHEQHKHAEARPLERSLVRGTLPRPLYLEYLAQRLWVHRALEDALTELSATDPRVASIFGPQQRQAENLRADLADLGAEQEAAAPAPATAALLESLGVMRRGGGPAMLGVLYVLEGSKNGARYVARAIRPAYGIVGDRGVKYLDPHGEEQHAVWAAFKVRLDRCDFDPAERDAIIDAARLCFNRLAETDDQIGGALLVG